MMNEQDSAYIRDLISSIASSVERQIDGAIERTNSYAAIYKLVPFRDGNQWCVLLGANLQDGIAGFGTTPHAAIMDFDRQMFNAEASTVPPAVKESLTTAAPAPAAVPDECLVALRDLLWALAHKPSCQRFGIYTCCCKSCAVARANTLVHAAAQEGK